MARSKTATAEGGLEREANILKKLNGFFSTTNNIEELPPSLSLRGEGSTGENEFFDIEKVKLMGDVN